MRAPRPLPLVAMFIGFAMSTQAADGVIRDFTAVDASFTRHPNPYTGNPDIDFRKSLIARRENIINMAEVALARAEDPSTEQLAIQNKSAISPSSSAG